MPVPAIGDAIANGAILPMDNHISLVFSGKLLRFPDGRILVPVFRGDALVPLSPYGPTLFIGHHVLVPRPALFALTGTFKKELYELT